MYRPAVNRSRPRSHERMVIELFAARQVNHPRPCGKQANHPKGYRERQQQGALPQGGLRHPSRPSRDTRQHRPSPEQRPLRDDPPRFGRRRVMRHPPMWIGRVVRRQRYPRWSGGSMFGMPSSIGYRSRHPLQMIVPVTISPASSFSIFNSRSPLHIGQTRISISCCCMPEWYRLRSNGKHGRKTRVVPCRSARTLERT